MKTLLHAYAMCQSMFCAIPCPWKIWDEKAKSKMLFLLCGKYGCALIGCLVGYGLALLRAYKSLDGMNGDISGYALTIGELCAVAVYALI